MKPQNFISWAGSVTNEMLLYFQIVNKVVNHPKIKRLKTSNLTTIKSMFVAFADTWQSYVYTYCIKTALKEML